MSVQFILNVLDDRNVLFVCLVNIYVWSSAAQYHLGQFLERWEYDEL